ncbi:MAG: putative LPS assembly protein LptD [Verrucomicrobiae bacterium]|nr:putative LPS assembly protein LptD [Verrucomicrobiae bacterium]
MTKLGGVRLAILLGAVCALAQEPLPLPPTPATPPPPPAPQAKKPAKPQVTIPVKIEVAEDGSLRMDQATSIAYAEKDVVVTYGDLKVTCDRARYNTVTREVWAEGNVHLYRKEAQWTGETLYYNFDTQQTIFGKFRAFHFPWFIRGDGAEKVGPKYVVKNGFITTCDYEEPHWGMKARTVEFYPQEKIVARGVTLRVGDVPVFYWPYVSKSLKSDEQAWEISPGQSSRYGFYALVGYNWMLSPGFKGTYHADYRSKRGAAAGLDVSYNDRTFGSGKIKTYFMHDTDPTNQPVPNPYEDIHKNRYRVSWQNQTQLREDIAFKADVKVQSDSRIIEEFFRREFRREAQPISTMQVEKYDPGYTVAMIARPQFNSFFTTTERLPELAIDIKRQQLFGSPIYYQGSLTAVHLDKNYSNIGVSPTNDFNAIRFDWFHEILYPQQYFGWLSVVPRIGVRETWYNRTVGKYPSGYMIPPTEGNYAGNYTGSGDQDIRLAFPMGLETSFKLSRVYDVNDPFWDVHGLRHIIQPVVDYTYLPTPSTAPENLYQFDTTGRFDRNMATTRLLSNDMSAFDQIDAIDRMNVLRAGVRNKLQTKRGGQSVDIADLNIYGEWRAQRQGGQTTFSDIYSELEARPFSWLGLSLDSRVSEKGKLKEMNSTISFINQNKWSIALSKLYIVDDQGLYGGDSDLYAMSTHWTITENWAVRTLHYYEARHSLLQYQSYSIVRDFHDWELSLNFNAWDSTGSGNSEYEVFLMMTLKALPGTTLSINQDL